MEIVDYVTGLDVKTVAVASLAFLLAMVYLRRRKGNLPPGPMQVPFLGSIFALNKDVRLFKVCEELAKTYGEMTTISLGLVLDKLVILNSADVVHEALVEKKEIMAGRDTTIWSFGYISEGFKDIAVGDFGPTWKLQRKLALKAIRTYTMGTKLEQLLKSSYSDVAALLEKEKEPFYLGEYIHLMLYNIICRMAFGKSYKIDDPEFLQWRKLLTLLVEDFFQSFLPPDLLPLLEHAPIKRVASFKKCVKELHGIIYKKLKEHKATFNPDATPRDLMDQLLLAQKESEEEEGEDTKNLLTDTHVVQTVLDVFFAGTETSSETLKWTLMYTAAYPDVQEKMHNEILDVLGDSDDLLKSKSKLTYCDAVLHEVMRLRPVVPMSLFHKVLQDTKLREYDLPKGTIVTPNIWGIHHDPANWDSPEEFRPERFLDEHGNIHVDSKIWLPFSSGKRKCLGEALARSDIMMIMALFFRDFKVSFPPNVTGDFEPADKIIDCHCKRQKLVIEKRKG
ncbi:steroid 17-alpha-hydroxylase/17,20 lyase [Lingula anatina]|uniref:Steroid 17-alpha-hydroxylase/17,20 lyase n=1 Tax=Lingula anatina TaxID=7574 RepID=A0A1S3IR24_LINAN|nr:steroid 17-alpha-hydroxylase/17,20 lyase [Lingula anatina]XP_013400666.1 steroid 17-alpha-hydroxylase/17,20 lyase [Lingula anatina]XP_013400667.1 steroid 17-alpha-hydroxylase/17,20 lyase [Lingula anatina]XP_013400668.1 steroid 17-alpha-hydroxylase/17,20 lyase [Lingula anatina]XP_013400669.1 steroid 17-alpha-hydroxylase/17,20 lyase [Lingula anatina]XP_013400670.1 steroid 17-alpha-hydroxylase/17,20 lyase [Lingula anatina]XP_013400671.1 steroid 17-alpha-hydroxylase/17,20 lyase [Lingula anatin|eukprot:XP_013400664.1 steroid 17-alpha-hydroxylase/17,20 lyase [Lingula anatina]